MTFGCHLWTTPLEYFPRPASNRPKTRVHLFRWVQLGSLHLLSLSLFFPVKTSNQEHFLCVVALSLFFRVPFTGHLLPTNTVLGYAPSLGRLNPLASKLLAFPAFGLSGSERILSCLHWLCCAFRPSVSRYVFSKPPVYWSGMEQVLIIQVSGQSRNLLPSPSAILCEPTSAFNNGGFDVFDNFFFSSVHFCSFRST